MMAEDISEQPRTRIHPDTVALTTFPFFSGADPDALAALLPTARWQSVAPEEMVLDFGDTTNDVFIIAEGEVRVTVRTPLGQEVILGDLSRGEVFGEMAAIDNAPRSASIAALHATRLCRLPAAGFMHLILRSPEVSLRLYRILTARLRAQDERMTELALLPARHRLAAELLRLSRPRNNSTARVISPPVLHHVLAARIGTRRETVTLALAELSRQNLAEISPRAIVLPRPERLRAVIDAQLRSGSRNVRPPCDSGPRRVKSLSAVP
jgi:CRP/FNR family transcriptional regulator, cyclic AMP receptor protein